jgi:hypothetical protein
VSTYHGHTEKGVTGLHSVKLTNTPTLFLYHFTLSRDIVSAKFVSHSADFSPPAFLGTSARSGITNTCSTKAAFRAAITLPQNDLSTARTCWTMSTLTHPSFRPNFSRQRSNSVPVFGLVNVSAEERSVLFNAAERATARRRRPVSVDSPGPAMSKGYDPESIQPRAFNFSTPSRRGFGGSHLRNAVPSIVSEQSTPSDEDEITPTRDDSKPLPALPLESMTETPTTSLENMDQRPVVAEQTQSAVSSPSSSPISPRRQVPNQTLKAYADGLFLFTRSRLQTAAPQNLKSLGLSVDSSSEESPPPTPELEEDEVREMSPVRPPLRSQFSDWSATTTDSEDDYDGYLSSAPASPHTPDMNTSLLSPDSFFGVDITPRVAQRTQWTSLSSARPSSGIEAAAPQSLRSSTTFGTTSANSTSDTFSYFTGFDSVTAAVETTSSQNHTPLELLQSPYYTPSRTQPPLPNSHASHSEPTSSVSDFTPFYRVEGLTPGMDEMIDLSRPPSWLVRAIG